MKLGAERKKVAILGGLLLVGGYFFYTNVISDSSDPPARPQQGPLATNSQDLTDALDATAPVAPPPRGPVVRSVSKSSKTREEFHPSLKRKPEEAIDPTSIDPTLRFFFLAKVQTHQLHPSSPTPLLSG